MIDNSLLDPGLEQIPAVKIMINIGATLDIPTGDYVTGKYGESILNGGLAPFTGVVAYGNLFKTTLMDFMTMSGMSRVTAGMEDVARCDTYDTEVNKHENHIAHLASFHEEFSKECDLFLTRRWIITDKTIVSGTEYYAKKKAYLDNKVKNKAKLLIDTPFLERDGKTTIKIIFPTFSQVDSFTEFETDDVTEMQKNELGDAGANTIHMRQGLAKMRFLMEAPRLNVGSNNYLLMTAQLGKETTMNNAGPAGQVPMQKLSHLKNGDTIKGVTGKFTFLTHNCYQCVKATPMINQGTKTVEYPRDADDDTNLDTDLNLLQIRNLRSKSGASGMMQNLIVSQSDGILPSLTEFHYIKEMDRYGIEGSNISYNLVIYPEVKLSRTTVRGKIDSDPKLRRALNIMAEMCQMEEYWRGDDLKYLCTPKELLDGLVANGYDMNMILSETRSWWCLNPKHRLKFLSTLDILKMAKGEYHPYWLEEDKRNIKKGF